VFLSSADYLCITIPNTLQIATKKNYKVRVGLAHEGFHTIIYENGKKIKFVKKGCIKISQKNNFGRHYFVRNFRCLKMLLLWH